MPFRVRARQRLSQLAGRGENRVGARLPVADDFLAERLAVHQLRCDEQVPVDLLERVDGADSRVRQTGGRAGLAFAAVPGATASPVRCGASAFSAT